MRKPNHVGKQRGSVSSLSLQVFLLQALDMRAKEPWDDSSPQVWSHPCPSTEVFPGKALEIKEQRQVIPGMPCLTS